MDACPSARVLRRLAFCCLSRLARSPGRPRRSRATGTLTLPPQNAAPGCRSRRKAAPVRRYTRRTRRHPPAAADKADARGSPRSTPAKHPPRGKPAPAAAAAPARRAAGRRRPSRRPSRPKGHRDRPAAAALRRAALRRGESCAPGPGTRYPIEWVYKRRDLPVEIQREFEVWRLVQDPEGIKGWVHQATLTGPAQLRS